ASFPASHPLFRGSMVRLAPDVRKVLEQYDVLFSVGGDLFTLSLPSDVDPMPPAIKLIHLDVDPWELGKNYPPAVAILGDPKGTLPDIIAAVRERMTSGARGAARLARSAGGRADRRRQRDVYLSGALDRCALSHRRGVRDPQQQLVSHPQATPARHARARRAGRQLCRHGASRSQDRFRLACAL